MKHRRKSDKGDNKKKSPNQFGRDVTLNDFANISGNKGRLRKPLLNNSVKNITTEEDVWDLASDNENCSGKKVSLRKKTNSECKETGSNVYSADIWYILSRYIRPEDVGRFAGICFVCSEIVNSAGFWFNLYKRYYRPVKEMPERLQPECMTRLYELKSCVIRALYYMYPPFASKYLDDNRMSSICHYSISSASLHTPFLIKRKCTSVWSKLDNNSWQYNFILKRENPEAVHVKHNKGIPDLLAMLDNISFNKAEGCILLQVIFKKFVVTPPVLGFVLTSVNCERNSVTMTFSCGLTSTCNFTAVTFNSVEAIRVHDWWSPHYPHSNGFTTSIIH